MLLEPDPPPSAPLWVITYSDLMTLVLAFFVMLVSMSELKRNDKFQGVADSMQERFGDEPIAGGSAGELQRSGRLAALAQANRTRRETAMFGERTEKAGAGSPGSRIVKPGDRTTLGTVIYFAAGEGALSEANQAELQAAAELLVGKPQKIEVRGHAAEQPTGTDNRRDGDWELAYQRARATMDFLVNRLQIEPERIRLSVAGPYEPAHQTPDPQKIRENPRVEIFLLEEVAADLAGTALERKLRFQESTDPK